ncbi:MAG: GNAT family N-acetyltransferase [Demequina sp.]
MDIPAGYTRVDLRTDRASEILEVDSWGFAFSPHSQKAARLGECFDYSRGRGVEISDPSRGAVGTLVGAHTSFPYAMRVPGGGTVPTAGLGWVAVHPGHRRRGLLSTMIDDHVQRSVSRGEPISTLFASETQIYQQFGYGLASTTLSMTLPRRPHLRDVRGIDTLRVQLESADPEIHTTVIELVQQRLARPGTMTTLGPTTRRELFLDLEQWRVGAEQLRILMIDDEEGPVAYALFAREPHPDTYGQGVTAIRTWAAATGAATHQLFAVATDLDLMDSASVSVVASDDPLTHLLADVRGAQARVSDNLWLRILDVAAALEARGYARDCEVNIEIADAMLPENTHIWRASIADGQATVTRAERGVAADLRLNIQELSAAYLGGVTIASLARAGLVEEVHPGAVDLLSEAMRGDQQPVGNIHF